MSGHLEILAPTEADTAALGARLARAFPPDEESAASFVVVQLHGDLGAGKTTLARGFLSALGVTAAVRSPTYTLVELYELPGLTAVHLDLYRLADASELEALGLSDWATARHVWLIEWPEKGGERTPPADLHITLTPGAAGHHIAVNAVTPLGERWIQRLA